MQSIGLRHYASKGECSPAKRKGGVLRARYLHLSSRRIIPPRSEIEKGSRNRIGKPDRDAMSRPLRVLIIEDNPDDRALIQHELKREHADLRMTSILNATDFDRALENDEAYDLVLTDYQLP